MYIHDLFSYKVLVEGGPSNLEFLAISVTAHFFTASFCIILFIVLHPLLFISLMIFVTLCVKLILSLFLHFC